MIGLLIIKSISNGLPDYVECSPDMERMQGVQLLKKNRNKKPPNAHVSFPCKYDGPEACVHNGNYPRRCLRSAVSCNKHMHKAHHDWSKLANAMYPVTVEDKSATDKPATDKPTKDKPALRRKKTYQMYSDSESKSESESENKSESEIELSESDGEHEAGDDFDDEAEQEGFAVRKV